MEMLRNEEQNKNAKDEISRNCPPFAKVIPETQWQFEKQFSPTIVTEDGIVTLIPGLKHPIAMVRDRFRMNPSQKVRSWFPSSNAETSKSLKQFGRKSDFSAKHTEKAFELILCREEDREISIDDNFTQFEKEPQPRTATEYFPVKSRFSFPGELRHRSDEPTDFVHFLREKTRCGKLSPKMDFAQLCSNAKVTTPEQF
jgi:hypothetical protein